MNTLGSGYRFHETSPADGLVDRELLLGIGDDRVAEVFEKDPAAHSQLGLGQPTPSLEMSPDGSEMSKGCAWKSSMGFDQQNEFP
jgi:hypothetical protein